MGVFDAERAAAEQALNAANAAYSAATTSQQALRNQRAALAGQSAAQTALLPQLQRTLDGATTTQRQAEDALAAVVVQIPAWARQEPPPTIAGPNPLYPTWQKQVSDLRAQVAADSDRVSACQAAVDTAQVAYADLADREPEQNIGRHPNPRHHDWEVAMAKLKAALDKANADADAARKALGADQGDLDVLTHSPPPTTIVVPNPDHPPWQTRMDGLNAARAQAQTARDAAVAATGRAQGDLDAANTALRVIAAQIQALDGPIAGADARVAAAAAALPPAQAALAKIISWINVVAGSGDDTTRTEVMLELIRRLRQAETEARAAAETARRTEAAAFHIANRADELRRRGTELKSWIDGFTAARTAAAAAEKAVNDKVADPPKPDL